MFDNSPFGQKIITPDLLIQQANQAVLQMLDCARLEDVVGHRILEFAHPDHRETGIPEALQANLFDKFSTSARSGVGSEVSTGLGLFITRQIVLQHRGKLWVESQEGTGTCFFVELH